MANRLLLAAFAALAWSAALTTTAAAAPLKTSFTLVGQTYQVTLPSGFCPTTVSTKPVADTMAAVDHSNLTDLTYFDCRLSTNGMADQRYGVLKTPKSSLLAVLPPRPAFLKQMGALITDGSMARTMDKLDLMGQTNRSITATTGLDLKLSGTPKFVATDDKAVYILASMSGRLNGGPPRKLAMAGAMTEIKGRIITWYVYGPYTSDADVAAVLRQVKVNIAGLIADNGG